MQAHDEDDLKKCLDDLGIDLQNAELLDSPKPNQTVSLGCGTLILIAIIVMIFSNATNDDTEREVQQLRTEVRELKQAVDAQTLVLKELRAEQPVDQ